MERVEGHHPQKWQWKSRFWTKCNEAREGQFWLTVLFLFHKNRGNHTINKYRVQKNWAKRKNIEWTDIVCNYNIPHGLLCSFVLVYFACSCSYLVAKILRKVLRKVNYKPWQLLYYTDMFPVFTILAWTTACY